MTEAHACATRALFDGAPGRVLVVAAHPDDETIGFGATLGELVRGGWRAHVLYVTDGAPRDPALRPTLRDRPPEEAAALRREEARAALRAQGLDDAAILLPSLGVVDQEATLSLALVVRALARRLAELAADVVVTHPYEGGHPDHDAVAFAVHHAAELERARGRPSALAEMTSYHREAGALVTGAFRVDPAPACEDARVLVLDDARRARKRRMLDAFASQAEVLAPFRADAERVRCAPTYDFTRPPHRGELHYETLPFGWTGARWCELARAARAELSR